VAIAVAAPGHGAVGRLQGRRPAGLG